MICNSNATCKGKLKESGEGSMELSISRARAALWPSVCRSSVSPTGSPVTWRGTFTARLLSILLEDLPGCKETTLLAWVEQSNDGAVTSVLSHQYIQKITAYRRWCVEGVLKCSGQWLSATTRVSGCLSKFALSKVFVQLKMLGFGSGPRPLRKGLESAFRGGCGRAGTMCGVCEGKARVQGGWAVLQGSGGRGFIAFKGYLGQTNVQERKLFSK